MHPKLSIITINLNNKYGLQQTIESVINQTFNDYEFIIIDGGSSDGSKEIIKEYETFFSYCVSEHDNGIYSAMNKGIERSVGNYCLFLNSGDWLFENKTLDLICSSNWFEDIIYGNICVFKQGKPIANVSSPERISLRSLLNRTIHHQSSFIKRDLFYKDGLYNEKLKLRADWDFWIRTIIKSNSSTRYINEIISNYNVDGISSDPMNIELFRKETQSILESHFPKLVLTDYFEWIEEKKDMEIMYWVKSKPVIYSLNKYIYILYKHISKLLKSYIR